MKSLVAFDYCEDNGEGNEENIGEVNESFISIKGNFKILKKLGEKLQKK